MIIDRLNESIELVVRAFPRSQFLDCRGGTTPYPFYDDMHPDTEGFKALARKFEQAMGVAMGSAIGLTSRKVATTKGLPGKSGGKGRSQKAKDRIVVTAVRSKTAIRRRLKTKRKK